MGASRVDLMEISSELVTWKSIKRLSSQSQDSGTTRSAISLPRLTRHACGQTRTPLVHRGAVVGRGPEESSFPKPHYFLYLPGNCLGNQALSRCADFRPLPVTFIPTKSWQHFSPHGDRGHTWYKGLHPEKSWSRRSSRDPARIPLHPPRSSGVAMTCRHLTYFTAESYGLPKVAAHLSRNPFPLSPAHGRAKAVARNRSRRLSLG